MKTEQYRFQMYCGPIWLDVTGSRMSERDALVDLPRRCQSWSFNRANYLSVVTAKYTQDVEQAEEQIVNGDIKCDGRHDVVCFTTV